MSTNANSFIYRSRKIVFSTDPKHNSRNGWTYILRSQCNRYIKIGRTKTRNPHVRIKYTLSQRQFRELNFAFIGAYSSHALESDLHRLLDVFRIKHQLNHIDSRTASIVDWGLTQKQVNSLLSREFRKTYSTDLKATSCRSRTEQLYSMSCIAKSTEVFFVPPRKVGLKITQIIDDFIQQLN